MTDARLADAVDPYDNPLDRCEGTMTDADQVETLRGQLHAARNELMVIPLLRLHLEEYVRFLAIAEDFRDEMVAQGHAQGPLPAEYDTLSDAIDRLRAEMPPPDDNPEPFGLTPDGE